MGIQWDAVINVPSAGAGELGFVQLTSYSRSSTSDGVTKTSSTGGSAVLDGGDMIYGSGSIGGGGSVGTGDQDSPGNSVNGTQSTSFSDSFQLYLVYRPSGGIWVTLSKMNWSASASSSYDTTTAQHQVNAGASPSSSGTGPSGSNSTELPDWADSAEAVDARNGF